MLLEESAQEASKERRRLSNGLGVNAEAEGHMVEDLNFMSMFLYVFLLHPGFGRLMRGFNMWNVMNGAGAGRVGF